jgi:hypothetical protein
MTCTPSDTAAAGRRLTLALTLAGLLLSACQISPNSQVSPGRDPLPVHAGIAEAADHPAARAAAGPDRSGWAPMVIEVPIHTTLHHPTYDLALGSHRERGAFPDEGSCLAVERTRWHHAGEAVADVVLAGASVVLAPFRMLGGSPPWALERSPVLPYERLPGQSGGRLERWSGAGESPASETPPR